MIEVPAIVLALITITAYVGLGPTLMVVYIGIGPGENGAPGIAERQERMARALITFEFGPLAGMLLFWPVLFFRIAREN